MRNKPKIESLTEHFKNRKFFTRNELFDFYSQSEPLKETTFRWRIHDLKANKIIRSLGTGLFTLGYLPEFRPEINKEEKELSDTIKRQFRNLQYCIWSTRVLNEFMLHIPGKVITMVEVEKETTETVFHYLQDIKKTNVFLDPGDKEIERYVHGNENAIVVRKLVTKSPLQNIRDVTTITLEKMIVDLFSDKKLFEAYQGSELVHIINTAYSKYAINFTTLLHYAKRRKKDSELKVFLAQKTGIPKQILHD